MKRLQGFVLALGFLLMGSTCLFGQVKLVGEVDASKFDTVSFKVNDRNPNAHPETYFQLKEGEKEAKFEVESIEPNDSGYGKSVLVIWEYLPQAARDAQQKFFRQVITEALPKLIGEEDEINIATFAWTNKGSSTLKFLRPEFGEVEGLADSVSKAKAPNGKGVQADHGSELFPAISEGISTLAARKSRAKVLIVLSSEFHNVFNHVVTKETVSKEALKADVAVYNLRFKQNDQKYSLDELADETYGRSYEVKKDDPASAADSLVDFAASSTQRALGLDYVFTFKSATAKDGQTHTVQLTWDKESLQITYNAPGLSMGEWIKANLALFIAAIVLLLGCIVGLILWMRKRKQAEAQRQAEEQRKLEEMKAKNQETEQRVQMQNQQLSQMQREEQERRRRAEEEKRREENEREAKKLLTEMYANGRQPRVTTMVNDQPVTMELPSPVTTVGRDPSCDIQFNLNTISRTHFQIIYQNGQYMLLDLGSTNGTSLNGDRVNSAELRHGDEIKAGEAILHFYI